MDLYANRSRHLDLMRTVGIIAVVWGHNYQPPYAFYPAFYFHIALFFFISGYFFKPQGTLMAKVRYIIKKTYRLLLPYLGFNLLFGLLTMWLKSKGIFLGNDVTLQTMFIDPFSRGDHFQLYLAAWFLFNLYFVTIGAVITLQRNMKWNFLILLLISMWLYPLLILGNRLDSSIWMVFLIRTIFGLFFYILGYTLAVYESKVQKILINPYLLFVLFAATILLNTFFGNIFYSIMTGSIGNDYVVVPILTTLCIILQIYVITYAFAKIFEKHIFLFEVGKYSFAIMITHLFIFFLINVFLYKLKLISFGDLSNIYFRYNIEKLWLVYQLPAIVLPIVVMKKYEQLKYKFLTKQAVSRNRI